MKLSSISYSALLLLAAIGCGSVPEEPQSREPTATQDLEISGTKTYAAHKISIPERDAASVRALLTRTASAFSGQSAILKDIEFKTNPERARAKVQDREHVRILFEKTDDAVEAVDLDVANGPTSNTDVGKESARSVAEAVLARLTKGGLATTRHFDIEAIRTSLLKEGGAMQGEIPEEVVREYRFFLPYLVDAVPVSNGKGHDYGLRVSVHRNGDLVGFRLRGVGLGSSSHPQGPAPKKLSRVVEQSTLLDRAKSEFQNSKVRPMGLRYLPSQKESGPREAFGILPEMAMPDGRLAYGRGSVVYYSITDPSESAKIWPTPDPNDQGDSR